MTRACVGAILVGLMLHVALSHGVRIPTKSFDYYTERNAQGLQAQVFEPFEYRYYSDVTYKNPWNYSEISVSAVFTPTASLGGQAITLDAFYFIDYERTRDSQGNEVLTQCSEEKCQPHWQIRWTPLVDGPHNMTLTIANSSHTLHQTMAVSVSAATDPRGYIGVAPNNISFAFQGPPASSSGMRKSPLRDSSYFAVGENVCWAISPNQTYEYDAWFEKLAQNGANYGRIWLGGLFTSMTFEDKTTGLGRYDTKAVWHALYVLKLAEKYDIRLMYSLDSFNNLRDTSPNNFWKISAYNAANGGMLSTPFEFFTNAEALQYYQQRIRYVASMLASSTHLLSWEWFNEVDLVSNFNADVVLTWQRTMTAFLKKHDPYNHMMTTSFSNSDGVPIIDSDPIMSYTQTHHYNAPAMAGSVGDYCRKKTIDYSKPHIVGEYGLDNKTPYTKDPQGYELHNGLWGATTSRCAGTAMLWWWDEVVDPLNWYHWFASPSKFLSDVPLASSTWTDAVFNYPASVAPTINAWGQVAVAVQGTEPYTVLAYVQNQNFTWTNQSEHYELNPITLPPQGFVISPCISGMYSVEYWDPVTNTAVGGSPQSVPCAGAVMNLTLPSFKMDLAIRASGSSEIAVRETRRGHGARAVPK